MRLVYVNSFMSATLLLSHRVTFLNNRYILSIILLNFEMERIGMQNHMRGMVVKHKLYTVYDVTKLGEIKQIYKIFGRDWRHRHKVEQFNVI